MEKRMRTAPPLRKPGPRKPRVIVRAEDRRETSGWGVLLTAVAIVAVLASAWVLLREPSPDSHFLAARRMIDNYERGQAEDQLNYTHPVYGEALGELAQVDPESVSAEEAATLAAFIQGRIAAMNEKLKEREARYAAQREHRRETDRRIFLAQERVRMNPVVTYPECELEGGDGHSHKH